MITLQSIHNGPPHSAHGGVAAGHMAALVDGDRAVVRFHSPPPLGEPLVGTSSSTDTIDVVAGCRRIATVRRTEPLPVEVFERLDPMAVAVAEARWLDHAEGEHPFPTCFGCGPDRSDGLGLAPGLVPGSDLHATFWAPPVDGVVPSWLVWAALDCPSGGPALASASEGAAVVTGELAVDIRRPVVGGRQYQIVSRRSGGSGRKIVTQAAIVDDRGRNLAVAQATWIVLAPESMVAS